MHRLLFALLLLPLFSTTQSSPTTPPACTQAQEEYYKTAGPDGALYPTWHAQLDYERQCTHDHEHGSDPLLVAPPNWRPVFGYAGTKNGQTEDNGGFKGYAFRSQGLAWYITQHQGSHNPVSAVCVRFHELDIAAWDASGAQVISLYLVGDFGKSAVNTSPPQSYTPPQCPNQASVGASTGLRLIPSIDTGAVGYEPWRVDEAPLPFFTSGAITFNVPNAQYACATVSCTANLPRTDVAGTIPANGAYRFVTLNTTAYGLFRIRATGAYSGTFYTNPTGQALRQAGDTDAVQQYIAPGLDVSLPAMNIRPGNWAAYIYLCAPNPQPSEMPFRRNPYVTGAN